MRATSAFNILIVLISLCVLSGCEQSTIRAIRSAHTEIRDVFVEVDDIIAPLLETAGDQCISQVEAGGYTGQDAYNRVMECCRPWFALDDAVTTIHDLLAEMETIYQSIDNINSERWLALVADVRVHARNMATIILDLNITVSERIMSLLEQAQTFMERVV